MVCITASHASAPHNTYSISLLLEKQALVPAQGTLLLSLLEQHGDTDVQAHVLPAYDKAFTRLIARQHAPLMVQYTTLSAWKERNRYLLRYHLAQLLTHIFMASGNYGWGSNHFRSHLLGLMATWRTKLLAHVQKSPSRKQLSELLTSFMDDFTRLLLKKKKRSIRPYIHTATRTIKGLGTAVLDAPLNAATFPLQLLREKKLRDYLRRTFKTPARIATFSSLMALAFISYKWPTISQILDKSMPSNAALAGAVGRGAVSRTKRAVVGVATKAMKGT